MEGTRRILVAGATGALGRPLVRRLVDHGVEVAGLTRHASKAPLLDEATAKGEVDGVLLRFGFFYGAGTGTNLMAGLESRIAVSNAKARCELQRSPRFATYREGLSNVGERLVRSS